MRLDKLREEELAKRKGMAVKTIISSIWLLISLIVAYFAIRYLFDQNILNYGLFYRQLSIPSSVPRWVIFGALMLVVVFVMEFFLFVGFFFASPEGRRRPGTPTLYSRNPDPLDPERFK